MNIEKCTKCRSMKGNNIIHDLIMLDIDREINQFRDEVKQGLWDVK